jgi:hypothetical protein
MNFTHYTVIDGSKLRPKYQSPENIPECFSFNSTSIAGQAYFHKHRQDFESFASQNEFPLANPEALKGRTEINKEEVQTVQQYYSPVRHDWNYEPNEKLVKDWKAHTHLQWRLAYLIKEGKEESRNWTEDFGTENGHYMCHCIVCNNGFEGHKGRIICKVCNDKYESELDKLQRDHEALKERYDKLEKVFDEVLTEYIPGTENQHAEYRDMSYWRNRAGLSEEGK